MLIKHPFRYFLLLLTLLALALPMAASAQTVTITPPSPAPVVGQSATFSATVGSAVVGNLQFAADGQNFGSLHPITVATPTASDSISFGSAGPHTVTATFKPTGPGSSATDSVIVQVAKADTIPGTPMATPSAPTFGQTVTLNSTVTAKSPGAGTPTGSVEFFDGAMDLGPGVIGSGGKATFTTSSLPVAPNQVITAQYNGDVNFNASTASALLSLTVGAEPTTTSVTSSLNPSALGQSVTFTITVTGQNGIQPNTADSVSLTYPNTSGTNTTTAAVALNGNGQAQINVADLHVSTDEVVTANFAAQGNFAVSSGTVHQKVTNATNTVGITSNKDPSVFNQTSPTLKYTATVTASAGVTPTGTIQFQVDGTDLGSAQTLVPVGGVGPDATASIPDPNRSVGNHLVVAIFTSGDGNYSNGNSGTLTQIVNKGTTTTAVSSPSANPSTFGQPVTFTATVTGSGGATPTGIVQFAADGNIIGSATLSGSGNSPTASFTTSSLTVSPSHSITAIYGGDGNFGGSDNSGAPYSQTVTASGLTVSVASDHNPAFYGQTITFTASVTGSNNITPMGSVTFKSDGTTIGVGGLSGSGNTAQAFLPISTLPAGPHVITATYGGDATYTTPQTGTLSPNEVVNPAGTATTVTSNSPTSALGQNVTFTATVATQAPGSGTPGGTVTFSDSYTDSNSVMHTQTLNTSGLSGSGSSATATYSTSTLAAAGHTITATYNPVGGNFGTSSNTVTQTVSQGTASTGLTSSSPTSAFGQSVTFTATVTGTGGITPTGTVTFSDSYTDSNSVMHTQTLGGGPQALTGSGSTATVSVPTAALPAAVHTITATYSGDGNYLAGTAATLTQTVNPAATTTTVTSSKNPSNVNDTVVFTATVATQAPGAGAPGGTVTFTDNYVDSNGASQSQTLGSGPQTLTGSGNNATATVSTSSLVQGSHTITATYSGDANHDPGNPGTLSPAQQVNVAGVPVTVTTSNATATFGQSVMFTATITGKNNVTPTRTIQFFDGGNAIGSPIQVSGNGNTATAALSTATLAVGTHTITAAYSGDSNYGANTGTLTPSQQVNPAQTTTAITVSTDGQNFTTGAGTSTFGQSITFQATVTNIGSGSAGTGVSPNGTVQFFDGGTALGPVQGLQPNASDPSGNSSTATISTASLSQGSHTIRAIYTAANANFVGSDNTASPLTQTVNPAATATTVASNKNPSNINDAVTFTATVETQAPGAGTPGGTVQFQDGGVNLGSPQALTGSGNIATASITTSSLNKGDHSIEAIYNPSGSNFQTSSNAQSQLIQTVKAASANVTVSANHNPSVFQQAVTFTATVQGQPGVPPTGTVQFLIDGKYVNTDGSPSQGNAPQTIPLSGGGSTPNGTFASASFTTILLSVTTSTPHQVTVQYNGDNNNAPSDNFASPLVQTVSQASTATTVSSSLNPSSFGQPVTFTASVNVLVPGAGIPTGKVTFQDSFNGQSNITLGTGTLGGNGQATFTTSSLSVTPDNKKTHQITATYNSDGNFAASSGALNGGQQVFNAQPTALTAYGPDGQYLLVPGTTRSPSHKPLAATDPQVLTLYGSGIVPGAQILFNTTLLTQGITYGTATSSAPPGIHAGTPFLQVSLDPTLTGVAGVSTIQVTNPNTAPSSAGAMTTIPISPVKALANYPLGTGTFVRMLSFPYDYSIFDPYSVLQGVQLTNAANFTANGYDPDVNLLPNTLSPNPVTGFRNTDTPLYFWDPTKANAATGTTGLYLTTRPGQDGSTGLLTTDLHFALGQAYWVVGGASSETLGVMMLGTPTQFNPASVNLQKGWNMVGNPFTSEVALANLRVLYAGVSLPFYNDPSGGASGVGSGVVSPIFWSYEQSQSGPAYQMNYSGLPNHDQMRPYEGYWLYCYQPCSLLVTK